MAQIPANNKEGLINKISKHLFLQIQSYIPFNTILNIFRHSKKYQEELDVNLSIYQKCFVKNKIKFDCDCISTDKLLDFLQKEFQNFTREEDKTSLTKIIEEIKNDNKIKKNFSNTPPLIDREIEYEENIVWKEDKYSNYLNLGYKFICCHDHRFYITNESVQEIIPSKCFPNVCVISTDNNFIIPASMMENLIDLEIRPVLWSKVLFYNDIEKEEIVLNKLERLFISRNRVVTSTLTQPPKNKNYDIKFKFKKLEEIKICLDLEKDFTYLNKYFGIDLLESIDDIKNDKILLFENMKNKILNYELLDTTNQFKLRLKFNGDCFTSFDLVFEIIRHVNNLKRYTLTILQGYDTLTHEEIYEENNKKEKILVGYKDIKIIKYNNTFLSSLNSLNDIRVILPNNDEMIKNKFIEFFNLNENNYSLRSLFLKMNNNINIGELFKNIAKFRVLQSLVVKDPIKDIKELINLVENILKIHTIERLNLYYLGKLSLEEKTKISQYSQNILFVDANNEDIRRHNLIIFETDEKYNLEVDRLWRLEY
jgi:hypothetical protein